MAGLRVSLCVLLLLAVGTQGVTVTPMEKVITLLKSLSAKVAADGKKEAAQYDKYSCFCKEQADGKLYSIEKSQDKIAGLKAQITELETAISELNSEVGDLSKKVSGLETEIKEITDKRDTDHAAYQVKAKDMNEAIDSCATAIEALKASKDSMSGAKLNFAQVLATQQQALSTVPGSVALLSELNGKGAPKFEYGSNDIIATLQSLLKTFKSMKQKLDFEESDINSAFESKKLGLSNEKTFAEKESAEKEAIADAKTETLNGAKDDKDEESKDETSDQNFLDQLTKDCEEKATIFDSRSKTRSDELTALKDATDELVKGAVPNFSANKKLVGIQKKAVVLKAAVAPVSFVQISNVKYGESRNQVIVKKVLESLRGAASRTGSSMLANVVTRVKMAEDHFVKVRALIKDLISKLKADAKAEATHKSFCDEGIKKAVTSRDDANAKIEAANAKITSFTAKKNDLKSDISTLQTDIAGLKKSLLEATELRNEEKVDHAKTTGMSAEAIESVKQALLLLQQFYNKNALVQSSKYTPPNADRDGNTLSDLAPETAGTAYKGSQSESKGIIGILEVILSDFERTKSQTEKDEAESDKAFADIEKETKDDITKKQGSVKTKQGELADTESDILEQQTALSDAQELLSSSTETLEGLENMCVKGEETWEERSKKRKEEIEALKDALAIFEDWQAGL